MSTVEPLKIGWISFHLESLPALQALLDNGQSVDFLITLNDEAKAKRSGVVDFAPICAEHGIEYLAVGHIDSPEAIAFMRDRAPDLLVVLGWSQILGDDALSVAKLGTIGAHASLLPHNRGSAPINWAIINGETETGNTLMWLSAGVDSGDIIDQQAFAIDFEDTCATLYDKVARTNAVMVLKLVAALEAGERPGKPQVNTDEPLLPRRRPRDGEIDWNGSARQLYDFVRALTHPYPGAFTWAGTRKYLVWRALPAELPTKALAGTVLGPVTSPEGRLSVACGTGSLVLLELEDAETGAILTAAEIAEVFPAGVVLTGGEESGEKNE